MGSNIPKGRIAIYSECHKLQDQRMYYTREGMKKIMREWMTMFKGLGCYIQVTPYETETGEKVKKKERIRIDLPKEEKKQFVRPPAVYTNIKSNYYNYD